MNKLFRVLMVILFAYVVVMGLLTLQYFFDRGDIKRASKVIYSYTLPGPQKELLVARMAKGLGVGQNELYCESALESRFKGYVFVDCARKTGFVRMKQKQHYHWQVDVVGSKITARNKMAEELMAAVRSESVKENQKPVIEDE